MNQNVKLIRIVAIIAGFLLLLLYLWASSEIWNDPKYSKLGITIGGVIVFYVILDILFSLVKNKDSI